ncbi:hypothetical protein EDD16DRAFT_1098671 [Pisolithus croceorrhizus]|nr:hypothetical protein EDD16DRAFT_1098671 [Pisolithus croceorrhizus]
MTLASWNGATGGFLVAYTAATFILYTAAPLLYRSASSPFYNISPLTSDFYGLLFAATVDTRAVPLPLLPVLCRHPRSRDILLACNAYVISSTLHVCV